MLYHFGVDKCNDVCQRIGGKQAENFHFSDRSQMSSSDRVTLGEQYEHQHEYYLRNDIEYSRLKE